MVESGDSDLIHQKLTMSQYLAYKSEPMGPELGDSTSSKERVSKHLKMLSKKLFLTAFTALFQLSRKDFSVSTQ